GRRSADTLARPGRRSALGGERVRLPRPRSERGALPHRRARAPRESPRLTRPEAGHGEVPGAQPPTSAPAARSRVWAAADTRRGARRPPAERARARAPLHLPERQHLASVRVRPGNVAE